MIIKKDEITSAFQLDFSTYVRNSEYLVYVDKYHTWGRSPIVEYFFNEF